MTPKSSSADGTKRGGQILVDALVQQGVDHAFCVAGESYLEVLDALYDADIRTVTCRQEGGAAYMAEAYGKLTGRPGICLVTRGPGACNASIGIHTAHQDSTPLILLVGQVARDQMDREAFQEVDYRKMYAPLCKWVAEINQAERIPEYIARAFHVATSGRPGPVVLALPEDMLRDRVVAPSADRYRVVRASPASADMAELAFKLKRAKQPVMLVGGGGWTDKAAADILAFAERHDLPVACSFRRLDLVDNTHPCYVGELSTGPNPPLLARFRAADLLVVVGARLGEITTQGYELLEAPRPRQTLIHVHADADELGRVYHPALPIQSGMEQFADAALALPPSDGGWAGWRREMRAEYENGLLPSPYQGPFDLGKAMLALKAHLPGDTIVTVDAGNFSGWPQRFLQWKRPMRLLGPTSGAMGYAVPTAVGASILHPGRCVIGCVGDGGFMMTGQELATAIHSGASPIILVFDNGMYGTIRMHQERRYPGRVSATDLTNPDFAALAVAYGAHGETVTTTEDLVPAFERARASGKPAILHLKTDPNAITSRTTIAAMREKALANA
jgi:acetolactate synthase-1/2/3 large subunit